MSPLPPDVPRLDGRWLREALGDLPMVVWTVQADGSIGLSEGGALAGLGLTGGALAGTSLFTAYADRPDIVDATRRALAGEAQSLRIEYGGRVFETRLVPFTGGESAGAVGIAVDVTAQVEDEFELERRSRLLHAVSAVAQRFLSEEPFDETVRRSLEILGRATDASRVYVFQNRAAADGQLVADQRWEWVAEGVSAELANPALQGFPLMDEAHQEMTVPLAWGEPYARAIGEVGPGFAGLLRAQQIQSLVVVPVFVEERWWGFVGFDDCLRVRRWSAEEIGALRTAAALFGAAWQRHSVELALRESEEKYRELVENATDLVWSIDMEGRFLSANRAMANVLGYPAEEIVGEPWERFIPEADQQAIVRRAIRDKLEGGQHRTSYEVRLLARSGDYVQVEVSSRLIERDGRPAAIQGTARDVSERRRLEEQLRQAVKMEAVGRLAGGVAHDFNNLLTAITGYGERILARLRATDPMRGEVMEILKAGERAADLTRELMAFGRKQSAAPREVDLNELVEQRLGMLRRIVGDDVVVVNLAEARVGRVLADPAMCEQVLVNLMVNARDAMPRGGRIELATAPAEPAEILRRGIPSVPHPAYVQLSVRDTGEGMDAETMARIFEPFFTTKELGKGTGLGLSTVYGIVKQCDGFIFADSHPGQGTVFHVYLPVAGSSDEAPRAGLPAAAAPVPQREKILLVEDEDLIRSLAEQILADRGYRVTSAANAAEAMEIAAQLPDEFDLLLTDIVMPGLSGNDLAQRLLHRFPKLRVLYMSGYSDSSIFRYGVTQERAAFLQKPFSADVLERRVRDLLDA
jgi:two-component system, cell cycle sensor histidine kinase and response regulator CckA